MEIKIALAGNPNCGKTTLFNTLTGSNQFVGNWPGVTVEKKEGRLKNHSDVIITDLPGIYSLSPYTPEEIVARNYLINERPNAILNIIDGTNIERNLYLTTQLTELGIPVVAAVNMMDIVEKNGDKINIAELSRKLGCKVVEISALKNTGITEAAQAAIEAARNTSVVMPQHSFSGVVEHALAHIEEAAIHNMPEERQRWYAVKIFERDKKVIADLKLDSKLLDHIEKDIQRAERELDDDAESIITNERYNYIESVLKNCYRKKNAGGLTTSDKIDKILTNRILALPIFAVIMFIVYFVSVTTVGTWASDWANDGVFGDGWHLFGIGSAAYEEAAEEYSDADLIVAGYEAYIEENGKAPTGDFEYEIEDEETLAIETEIATLDDYKEALTVLEKYSDEPDPADYGIWIPGIPVIIEKGLNAVNAADWLCSLILDGIVGGVGSVLGFVPQMIVLFIFLAFLEACGYMARVAFVMDRIFRKFGLSGKSFIPMLISTGCGVPGIMASRTIENERDRRMTITTTTFIPCGAKLPVIALIAGAMFGRGWWVAPSAYFVGILAIIVSGVMLKKTKLFSGDVSPFVMELPAYHMPTLINVLRSMWERAWSFIKKAGTVILLSAVVLWFLQSLGFEGGSFGMVENINNSILATLGNMLAWIFTPLGWGNWQSAVATITGLIAKENIVGSFGVLLGGMGNASESGREIWANMREMFTPVSAYSFLIFNLLCAPCFAAMGAIRREMNSAKWTFFAIGYQCLFAYVVSLIIYQIGSVFTGNANILGLSAAIILTVILAYMVFRPSKESGRLNARR